MLGMELGGVKFTVIGCLIDLQRFSRITKFMQVNWDPSTEAYRRH